MKTRLTRIIIIILITLSGFLIWQSYMNNPNRTSEPTAKISLGGDFRLLGHDNKYYDSKDYRGKFMLVYFGYTYCPDVCPAELSKISNILNKLEEKHKNHIVAFFITIDPYRDTMNKLQNYMNEFPNIIGLTGTEEEIHNISNDYKIYKNKLDENDKEYYLIDHSTFIYLMSPNGKFLHHYTINDSSETILNSITNYLKNQIIY